MVEKTGISSEFLGNRHQPRAVTLFDGMIGAEKLAQVTTCQNCALDYSEQALDLALRLRQAPGDQQAEVTKRLSLMGMKSPSGETLDPVGIRVAEFVLGTADQILAERAATISPKPTPKFPQ